jgi:hypothetical protein
MAAIIEWVIGVLRAGGDETVQIGDPYDFSATLIRRGDTVEIVGGTGKVSIGMRRDIAKALKAVGVNHMVWDRKKKGGNRHIEAPIGGD